MLKRKLAIIILAIVVTNASTTSISALANELKEVNLISQGDKLPAVTEAKVSKFGLYGNDKLEKYNKVFKVDNSKINKVTNNGGNYGSSNIQKSIDGNFSTHWETGKSNDLSFSNEVIIELDEIMELDRIVYAARQDAHRGKGFAKKFEIYGTTSEENYELVTEGSYSGSTGDVIEIKFNPTKFKKIKFKFVEVHSNKASASEFMLYKEDSISDKMERLFTDDTCSKVSEEFNTIEKINELELEVKSHPLYESFKEKIIDAKILVENKIKYSKSKVSIFSAINSTGLDEYNKIYKMNKDNIKSITNNGKNSSGGPIQNAVDGDVDTFWHTGQLNSSSFTNEVVIEFKERKTLDRIIYGNRRGQTRGFAEKFTIYGSNTSSGDTFVKLTDGEYKNTQDFIEILFEETELKRVKFVFDKGTDNWASASEIWFYSKDEVSNKMKRLFTDSNKNVVNEEFNTLEKINKLEIEVKAHPLFDIFKTDLEDAKIIVSSNKTDSTIAVTSQFELYNNTVYTDMFKVKNDNILSIKNNAGHYGGQVIKNAIDDNINTYWETNKNNTSSFNNEVEVEFKNRVTLDRVVYGARQSDTKGFAEEFEIYGSNTTSGNTYNLVATGKYNIVSNLVEAKFEPTEFKRLKFKFVKSNKNSATLNELIFYKEDKLKNMLPTIFIDGTMTALKEEFNSKKAIDELLTKVNAHPLKDMLQTFIDRAYKIINNDLGSEQVKINLPQLGDIHGNAKKNLSMSSFGTNYITTGIVATPGETIEVYLDAEKGEALPQIVFTQSQGHYGNWKRIFTLNPGYNKFIVPEIFDENWKHKANKGGAIYIVNPYTDKQQSKEPVVIIEGGMKFPVFNAGDNEEDFLKELKEYKNYMDKNPDTAVDIFEYNSSRVLFTGTTSDAYQVYVNEKVDINTSIRVWSEFIDEGFKFAGLEDNSETPNHDTTNLRTAIRVMQPFGAAYAAYDHIGIQKKVADDILRIDKNNINGIIWGTMHEIGHQMDISARKWGEITNNMWANEMAILNGKGCRLNYENLYSTVGLNHSYDKIEFGNYGVSLGMFWQLELYKDGYWAEIERMYRDRKPSPKNEQEKRDLFALYASEIIGENLTEHFERYGFGLSENCKNQLKKYPNLKRKSWYINSKIMQYKGTGFNENASVKVSSEINVENKINTLTFEIDKENKDDLLGYEILKNGEVIGFTGNSTFQVKDIDVNENDEYSIIAYDIMLGKTKSVNIKGTKPTIEIPNSVSTKVGEEIDLGIYSAYDLQDGDLTSSVVRTGEVNFNKSGEYTLTYTVTDIDNNTTSKSRTVAVVDMKDFNYLTNYDWKSANNSYGKATKDKSASNNTLRLTDENGAEIAYERGIGTHANSTIIYDLSDKNYDYFTSYVGVDRVMFGTVGSVTFQVIVDGVVKFESGLMNSRDAQKYVEVDINGAKELKLIVTDGGNGNGSDHATWGDSKLHYAKEKLNEANLQIPRDISTKTGVELTLDEVYTALDEEDGDITHKVQISGKDKINYNKPGTYEIIYTVEDNDGNISSKTRKVHVVNMDDYAYLSDKEWKSAHNTFGRVEKDRAMTKAVMKLTGEDGEAITYKKGLGTHSIATIIYDLTKIDAQYFTSFIGVDNAMYGNKGSVEFQVFLDGEKVYESGVMNSTDKQKFVEVELTGAKELKLIMTDGGNGNESDHGNWADAKLYYSNEDAIEINRSNLDTLLKEVEELQEENYIVETWNNLMSVKENVILSLNDGYNQNEIDTLYEKLKVAKDNLKVVVEYDALESLLKVTKESIKELKEYMYTQNSWSDLIETIGDAEIIVADKTATTEEVDLVIEKLTTSIGKLEVISEKVELEKLIDFADTITDISFVGGNKHQKARWNNFVTNKEIAKKILLKSNATVDEVNLALFQLQYFIDELQMK